MPRTIHSAIVHESQDFPITVESVEGGTSLIIHYGKQSVQCDTYAAACHELGGVLLHSLACAGRVDWPADADLTANAKGD